MYGHGYGWPKADQSNCPRSHPSLTRTPPPPAQSSPMGASGENEDTLCGLHAGLLSAACLATWRGLSPAHWLISFVLFRCCLNQRKPSTNPRASALPPAPSRNRQSRQRSHDAQQQDCCVSLFQLKSALTMHPLLERWMSCHHH